MNVEYSRRFLREFAAAPAQVRKAFEKQIELFRQTPSHPSLRAKKYNAAIDLWQARVNRDWRFYFTIEDGAYLMHSITAHPK
jgi:plasmid maintenance system killer protein